MTAYQALRYIIVNKATKKLKSSFPSIVSQTHSCGEDCRSTKVMRATHQSQAKFICESKPVIHPRTIQRRLVICRLKHRERRCNGKWGKHGVRLLPCRRHVATEKPTFLYPDDMSCTFLPLLKDIPENKIRESRRASAHAAITITITSNQRNSVFLLVHEGINFIARSFSSLVLAIFEKTFRDNLVGSSWVILFRWLVSLNCLVACCLQSILLEKRVGACCADCAVCARVGENK
jgi:hypothetical protein